MMAAEEVIDLNALLVSRNTQDLYPITPSTPVNFIELILSLAQSLSLPTYTEPATTTTTSLSLSGKMMLIDCEFDTTTSSLIKLNFNPTQDPRLEALLSRSIRRIHAELVAVDSLSVLEKIERERRMERALLTMKQLLRELMRLDDLSSETFDAFKYSRTMSDTILQLMTVDIRSPLDRIRTGHGFEIIDTMMLSSSDPYTAIIYHLNAARLLSSNFDEVIAALLVGDDSFLNLKGVSTMRIILQGEKDGLPNYSAVLNKPVPIFKVLCQSIPGVALEVYDHQLVDLLISAKSESKLSSSDVYEFSLGPDSLIQSYSLDLTTVLPSSSITTISFQTPQELFDSIKTLKTQLRLNELIESIFKPEKKVDRKPLSKSKQKLKKDAMDLDSLFNDNLSSLPITLYLNSPTTLLLSFPAPHRPIAASYPMTISITASSDAYEINLLGSDEILRMKANEKMTRILETGRDVPLLLRFIEQQLKRSI